MRGEKYVSEELKWIVEALTNQPFFFDDYVINGRHFNTKSFDDMKANQNSGISIVACCNTPFIPFVDKSF